MTKSICGANCGECTQKTTCKGCYETGGCPFGKQCFIAKYITLGGQKNFLELKSKLISEINSLNIVGMPPIPDLFPLNGSFVNLEYSLPCGKTKLLDDNDIYLGFQLRNTFCNSLCFGIVANLDFIIVSSYEENGNNPELLIYKKR